MNKKLKILFDLQNTDTRLSQIERSKEGLPQLVNEIQAGIDSENRDIQNYQDSINKLNQHLSENSRMIDDSKKFLDNCKERRNQVTNNREYEALINEVAFNEKQLADSNDKKDLLIKEIAKNQEAAEKSNAIISELTEKLIVSQNQLSLKMAETEIEEAALQKDRSNLISQLPVQIIRLYERIYTAKNGIAVAKADDGSCSGCHTKLPSAKLSELKRYDSLVHCDVCSRILAYKLKDENNK